MHLRFADATYGRRIMKIGECNAMLERRAASENKQCAHRVDDGKSTHMVELCRLLCAAIELRAIIMKSLGAQPHRQSARAL